MPAATAVSVALGAGAQADTCTPPPPADTTTPLSVICQDDALPPDQSFSYGNGPHAISILSGSFRDISSGSGDDIVTLTFGSLNDIDLGDGTDVLVANGGLGRSVFGGPGDDQITVNGGEIAGAIVGSDGNDVIRMNGGRVSLLTAGDGDDTIELNGGMVRTVIALDGNDRVVLGGSATVIDRLDGGDDRDTLALVGTGTLDGSKVAGFENLDVRAGADWAYGTSGSNVFETVGLTDGSSFAVPLGVGLIARDLFVETNASLTVDGRIEFEPATFGFSLEGTLTGSGSVARRGGFSLFDLRPTAVIRPGSSIGQLDIENVDVFVFPGALLIAEVDPTGTPNADLLNVTGNVNDVNDLTIEVVSLSPSALPADYVAGNDYVVLRANALDGDSPTIVEGGSLPALVDVAIVGSPSATGEVALAFSEVPVAQLPLQPAVTQTGNANHSSVVSGLAATAASNPNTPLVSGTTPSAALQTMTNSQLSAFNEVHAEPFSSYQTVLLEDYDMVAGIVLGRAGGIGLSYGGIATPEDVVASTRDNGSVSASQVVWGSVARVDGSVDGEGGLGDFGYSVTGLVLGADVFDDGVTRAGVYGAINRTSFGEHDLIDQEIEGDSYHLGTYASWQDAGGLTVSGVLGFAAGRHDSRRNVPDVGAFTGGTAEADFDTRGFYLGGQVERRLALRDGWSVTPAVAAVYARTTFAGAEETGGGDFDFTLDEATAESFMTTIGATLVRHVDTPGQNVSFLASAHYHHDWLAEENAQHEITVRNPILGSFTQVGQNRGTQGVTAGLGVSAWVSDTVELGAGYAYTWNDNGTEHRLGANVLFRW